MISMMDRQTNPVCCLTYPVLSVLLTSNLKLLKKFLVGNTDRPDSNEDYSLDLEVGGDSEFEEESQEEYVQVLMDSPKLNDSRLDS